MKRLVGLFLSLVLTLSMAIPVVAVQRDVPENGTKATDVISRMALDALKAKSGISLLTLHTKDGKPALPGLLAAVSDEEAYLEGYAFFYGYDEGYDIGYEDGYAKGEADRSGSYDLLNPYGEVSPYREVSYEYDDDIWDNGTYQQGYLFGLSSGYEDGYYWGYYDKDWDRGYEQGYPLGYADYYSADGYDESVYPGYREDYESEEAYVYRCGLNDGYWDGYWEAEWNEQLVQMELARQEEVKAAGGAPGQLNVMLNGACIPFPDAGPEMSNDRTMVPLRAMMEALGAKVEALENNRIKLSYGDTVISLTIGEKLVTVERDAETKQVELDTESYLSQDRTYVPLRFISETFGYDVYWDGTYNMAVMLDQSALTAKLDQQFMIYNIFMKTQGKVFEASNKISGEGTLTVEIIDTIEGNKALQFKGSLDAHVGGGAMTMDGAMDLSAVASLLETMYGYKVEELEESGYKDIFQKQTFSMKITAEGKCYVKMPMMDQLMGAAGEDRDKNVETWYYIGDTDPAQLHPEGYTVGSYLYQTAVNSYTYPFYYHESLMASADAVGEFLGDGRFSKSGSSYKMSLDIDGLLKMIGPPEEDYEYYRNLIKAFSLSLSFSEDGRYQLGAELKAKTSYYGTGPDMNMVLDMKGSSKGEQADFLLQLRNQVNITFDMSTSIQRAAGEPDTSIPEGAQLIDLTQAYW